MPYETAEAFARRMAAFYFDDVSALPEMPGLTPEKFKALQDLLGVDAALKALVGDDVAAAARLKVRMKAAQRTGVKAHMTPEESVMKWLDTHGPFATTTKGGR